MALAGKHNVVKLLDIVKEGEVYCLVFEYIKQTDYKTLLGIITPRDCSKDCTMPTPRVSCTAI
jgi:hypothetical protein